MKKTKILLMALTLALISGTVQAPKANAMLAYFVNSSPTLNSRYDASYDYKVIQNVPLTIAYVGIASYIGSQIFTDSLKGGIVGGSIAILILDADSSLSLDAVQADIYHRIPCVNSNSVLNLAKMVKAKFPANAVAGTAYQVSSSETEITSAISAEDDVDAACLNTAFKALK